MGVGRSMRETERGDGAGDGTGKWEIGGVRAHWSCEVGLSSLCVFCLCVCVCVIDCSSSERQKQKEWHFCYVTGNKCTHCA